ncbi:MAG: transglutaminase family protein, partial [Pseudomonadota bacterium]|nr:transglutaminase family protein [Pseudomonadota bacterium]
GWIGLDPTSGLFAAEGHIPLACTPEPQSAAPITGATDRCETEFAFFNRVTRVHEDPRVTLPYSETQWQAIDALGEAIDEELQAADVRLTMGGEPTFVAIDDMESAQWNTAADGEHKRDLAQRLLLRLRQRFAPEALVHYGQGKWYPGEPLPRWQLGLHWRTDGQPVWRDSLLLADALKPGRYGYPQAKTLATELCRTLGVNPGYLMAAREDPFYYLWQEDRLPQDVDPEQADLADAAERRKLAALLRQGLDHPVGLVLPLRWDDGAGGWRSSRWPLRGKRLYLLPGDSPMGLRLPLESLPWESREQDIAPPASLFAAPTPPLERFDLAVHQRREAAASSTEDHGDTSPAQSGAGYLQVIHTALCIELRDKRIHLFLPPLPSVEQYLDLVASIEATAREQRLAVVIEGYEPPRDNRMMRLLVTPDPGVIEVNIHPAASWRDLQRTTEVLYEEARQSRMGTEKFMLDGRHTGTGGGNHVTLGGPTPADSPMLRRPDLLRSLISYWQNHPSLSYVFSGLFIGPTSQAPRVDEARHENLYELEIAFQQMPDGAVEQPWLVDRLLRHLLVDITGNTHRAEFCIDKLYSPDSATGRLGLLEMRAFEMPPHPRMSLVQMLLLRALVARFWRTPYRAPLVRWGTALHDRFMLPHFLWKDLREVIEDLNRSGYRFDIAWFDPFFEFRFPLIGIMNVDGLELELRQAIEPWHVLGEEAAGQGTARYVDSSVERLQIKVRGMTTPRHVVACNGRRVPLRSTQSPGEFVAGVRYRAWQPPSALHPTIGVHTPLVFDLVDTWNGRSLGGCTYHVSHPGGRSYDTFPVNAYEAQGRRISRFYQHGHSIGAVEIPPQIAPRGRLEVRGPQDGIAPPPALDADAEYPTTLDLRR